MTQVTEEDKGREEREEVDQPREERETGLGSTGGGPSLGDVGENAVQVLRDEDEVRTAEAYRERGEGGECEGERLFPLTNLRDDDVDIHQPSPK